MKVLCSNPPWWIENAETIYGPKMLAGVRAGSRWPFTTTVRSTPGKYVPGDYLPYPFFLGATATYLARETGVDVEFRDSLALREDYDTYFNYLREQDFDYIIIESASPSWAHDAALIGHIKKQNPRTKIVATGPIAAMGEKLLLENPLEAVIQGEYEKGCVRVINGAQGLLPHDLLTEEELNNAPYPYYDHLYAHRYWDGNPKGQCAPQAQVLSSRGCPFKCIFCVWPAVMSNNDPEGIGPRKVRRYHADYMEGLLTELVGRYKYRTIYFDDDTFNLGDQHVQAMCGVMQRIGLPWSAMCRADTISRDTWALMRESGCFGVKIGFESGNQWVVDNIVRKNLDLEQARDVVFHLKELGFTVHGTFTVGLPGETPEQRADTARYRNSLPLDSFQESGTAEIEGSPLATLRKSGHLDKYVGANLESGYLGENDGTRKLLHLAMQDVTFKDAERCHASGKPALAEAICRNLLEQEGENAQALDLLGVLAAETQQFDLAVRYFVRATQADPTNADACLHLGRLLRDQGLVQEAAACFQRTLELDPDCPGARLDLEQLLPQLSAPVPPTTPGDDAQALLSGPAWGRMLQAALRTVEETEQATQQGATAQPSADQNSTPASPVPGKPAPGTPRIIVLDHGLRFAAGHHFAYNLGLKVECMKREIPVEFYVFAECAPEVVSVLQAKPVLMPSKYAIQSDDNSCWYLEDFNIASKITEYNLYKNLNSQIAPSDIIFVHTSEPKIVMGIAAWYQALSKERRPYLCLKFQNHCYQFVEREYKELVRSVFRLCLKPFIGMEKVHVAASNKLIATQIETVADKPCTVFPIPLQLSVPARSYRSRQEKKTLCIGYAGEGRAEQGVSMLPGIVRSIVEKYPDVNFTIQLACDFADEKTLRRLRVFGDRVTLMQQCLVGSDFHRLISTFDALLLPYDPERYIERSSQIVIEAIALGVPLIIPGKTSLSLEAKNFDCGYSIISAYAPAAVVEAIEHFLENHDRLTQKSAVAAGKCSTFHCGKTLVDLLLQTCLSKIPA